MSDFHVGRLHDGNRWVVAIYQIRRTRMLWIAFDYPLRMRNDPATDATHIRELPIAKDPKRVARKMLRKAGRFQATKSARSFLKSILEK